MVVIYKELKEESRERVKTLTKSEWLIVKRDNDLTIAKK